MKYIIFTYLIICTASCDEKSFDYYHGVVIDYNSNSLPGVMVKTEYLKTKPSLTNESGYFKLPKSPNTITSLIFSKDGYVTDTIKSVYSHGGEKLDYRFIFKKIDTIPLKKITFLR